ncbi:MAG TPA: hypothetical protein DEO86_05590 [Colwellia sp.]|nr:hypothetical protein [Colwellia sp.]|tara:strand:+ start:44 stop:1279 length:1236 start_codon:yes stop_codon:yes gene_type:complete
MAERPQMTTALNGGYANQFANMLKQPVKQSWLPTRAIHGGLGLLDAYNQWEAPDPTTLDGALEYGSMPAKAVVGLGKGMADALKGAMDNPQDTEKVFDLASMVAGGGFGASKILGDVPAGSIGMFAGRMAKTADQNKLKQAEKMIADGKNRDEVWKETGWYKDVDGQMKFEIDDSKVDFDNESYKRFRRMREGSEVPLSTTFPHKEIAKAYPTGARFPTGVGDPWEGIGFDDAVLIRGVSQEGGGSASPGGFDYVNLNTGYEGPKLDRPGMRSTMLHEIQHLVQGKEGFGIGGNLDKRFVPAMPKSVKNKLAKLEKKYKSLEGGSPERIKVVNEHRALNDQYTLFGNYQRLAGEAEARNVQTRKDMTPSQRKKTTPWSTLDVPEDELIVRGENKRFGKSMVNALQGKDRNP